MSIYAVMVHKSRELEIQAENEDEAKRKAILYAKEYDDCTEYEAEYAIKIEEQCLGAKRI